MMKHIFFAILLCLFLQSCQGNFSSPSTFDFSKPGPPNMRWMYDGPPELSNGKQYPALYVQGWRDGCETGVSANTNSFYKYTNTFKQDYQLAQNEIYYKGWKDSFMYCGRYIYNYSRKLGFF